MSPAPVEVVVVGGGMAGLVTAHTLTRAGARPVVLEAAPTVGGLVTGGRLAELEVDLGAEAFALRRPEVGALCAELGLAVERPAHGSWLWSPAGAHPIPARTLLGIPADPAAADVRAVLGPDGAARAAADADLPATVGADATDLARLVRARMGSAVLERLVRPVAGGIHAADPADLAVDAVVPGLRTALAARGTLAGAVAALLDGAPPGAPVASVTGGMFRLPRALARAVTGAGGTVRTDAAVTGLQPAGTGGPGRWVVRLADGTELATDRVVLATTGQVALTLLAPLTSAARWTLPRGSAITHVTLLVAEPALDGAPRGSGVLVAPGAVRALTHLSAKWPGLGAAAGPGRHVLRVSYGRPGEDTAHVDAGVALADAARLLDVPLAAPRLLAHRVVRRADALPALTAADRDRVQGLSAALPAGLHLTGTWVAGTGLAAVTAHAQHLGAEIAAGLAPAH